MGREKLFATNADRFVLYRTNNGKSARHSDIFGNLASAANFDSRGRLVSIWAGRLIHRVVASFEVLRGYLSARPLLASKYCCHSMFSLCYYL
jgi:hypothetical protein